MEFEVLDTPDGVVCAQCFKVIADPAGVFVMVNSRPNVVEAAIWLCWGCIMEMPERVAEARTDLANRLELLEARSPSA